MRSFGGDIWFVYSRCLQTFQTKDQFTVFRALGLGLENSPMSLILVGEMVPHCWSVGEIVPHFWIVGEMVPCCWSVGEMVPRCWSAGEMVFHCKK